MLKNIRMCLTLFYDCFGNLFDLLTVFYDFFENIRTCLQFFNDFFFWFVHNCFDKLYDFLKNTRTFWPLLWLFWKLFWFFENISNVFCWEIFGLVDRLFMTCCWKLFCFLCVFFISGRIVLGLLYTKPCRIMFKILQQVISKLKKKGGQNQLIWF